MEYEKPTGLKTATELLVALPVMHILATSLFLIGYYSAFGNRIYIFSSPSDIFTASIGNVGPNYLSGLTFPVVFLLWNRGYFGAWTSHEAAINKPEGPERTAALAKVTSDRKFLIFLVVFSAISQACMVVIFYFKWEYIPYQFFGFFLLLIFSLGIVWYSNKVEMNSLSMFGFLFIGLILIGSLFNGMGSGQSDRRLTYIEAAKSGVVCSNGAALRIIGDHILLVGRDGRHFITDHDCKILMLVPKL